MGHRARHTEVVDGNRDEIDLITTTLAAGPDPCEGRHLTSGSRTKDCRQPATQIIYIDGGRGDWLSTFCPKCGDESYAAKAVLARWDGSQWVEDLPRSAWPGPTRPHP